MNTVEKTIRVKLDEARKPFLNVEWVKEMAPGVKRLGGKWNQRNAR